MMNALLLIVGIALLAIGGEGLIRGALAIANRLQISPLLSGLLIVGFGTSAPELVVSIDAVTHGQPDIAIGNVVGSNIGNILLILGLCALITPLYVKPQILQRDASVVVATSILFLALTYDGMIGVLDASILLIVFVAYLIWAYRSESTSNAPSAELHKAESEEVSKLPRSLFAIILFVVGGLCLLILGSQVLLKGAVGLAEYFSVPEAVVGLTIVAVGTSLPELSISVMAALRKHADVAIGNVLGSNIFNLLGILGVSALLHPLSLASRISQFDQWVMLAVSVLLLLFLYTGKRLNRIEGGILLLGYIVYVMLSLTIFVV
ncbi:calcium/sodium antiporter [Bermanella marisrubri]|nr:calcium/sodium antiporter [Bermanella marisrubri]QIZ84580.1 calcium/sodium antiporter [Bermanella marisrubri]